MSKPRKPYNKKATKAKPNDRMTAERKPTPPPQRVPDEIERKIYEDKYERTTTLNDLFGALSLDQILSIPIFKRENRILWGLLKASQFLHTKNIRGIVGQTLEKVAVDNVLANFPLHILYDAYRKISPPRSDDYAAILAAILAKIETQGAPAKRNPQDEVATLVYEVYMTDRIWKNPFPGEIRKRRKSTNAAVDYVRVKCPKTDTEFYDRCTDARTAISNLGKTKAKVESLWRTIAKKKAKPSGRGDKSNKRKTYTKSEMMQYIEENGGNANDYDNRRIYPTLPCSYS